MGENIFKGMNFSDWEMNMRIVLGAERLLYTIQTPLGPKPNADQLLEMELWKTHSDDNDTSQSIILAFMTQHFR